MTDNPNITLDMNRIPEHIAVIMDGNGRWATERGKERSYGHQAGVETGRYFRLEMCTALPSGSAMVVWLRPLPVVF